MDPITRYFFESGELKRTQRSGWWTAHVKDPESVAEHSFRTAVIAFFLAELEGEDPHKVASAALFHDVHEARIMDIHKIANRYVKVDHKEVEKEQIADLPLEIRESLHYLLFNLSDKEKTILKDADLLEMALQAKEYQEIGYPTQSWIDVVKEKLVTKSAKKILGDALKYKSTDWWKDLKRID